MNDRRFMLIMILVLLVCFLTLITDIFLLPINEKLTASISTSASLLAGVTVIVSLRSLQKTEETLKIIQTEQKISDIRESLNLFYYPLNNFIERIQIATPSIQDIENATKHKYLATEETRKQFETLQQNNYFLDPENYKIKSKILLQYIENDIVMLENDLLAKRLQH